jgi:NitT/TauT family transport system permease protein
LNVQPLYLRAAQTMGSKGWHLWSRVIFPAALPGVLSGMKQGWAFAWRSLMAAEIFVVIVTGFGLGSLLNAGRELLRMDQVMGVMAVVMLVGLLADLVFFAPLERWLRRSRGLER